MWGKWETHIILVFWSETLKERSHFGGPGIDGPIILTWPWKGTG
jgi:hypothetical protein